MHRTLQINTLGMDLMETQSTLSKKRRKKRNGSKGEGNGEGEEGGEEGRRGGRPCRSGRLFPLWDAPQDLPAESLRSQCHYLRAVLSFLSSQTLTAPATVPAPLFSRARGALGCLPREMGCRVDVLIWEPGLEDRLGPLWVSGPLSTPRVQGLAERQQVFF